MTAKNCNPSPLKSPIATAFGTVPTDPLKDSGAWRFTGAGVCALTAFPQDKAARSAMIGIGSHCTKARATAKAPLSPAVAGIFRSFAPFFTARSLASRQAPSSFAAHGCHYWKLSVTFTEIGRAHV